MSKTSIDADTRSAEVPSALESPELILALKIAQERRTFPPGSPDRIALFEQAAEAMTKHAQVIILERGFTPREEGAVIIIDDGNENGIE